MPLDFSQTELFTRRGRGGHLFLGPGSKLGESLLLKPLLLLPLLPLPLLLLQPEQCLLLCSLSCGCLLVCTPLLLNSLVHNVALCHHLLIRLHCGHARDVRSRGLFLLCLLFRFSLLLRPFCLLVLLLIGFWLHKVDPHLILKLVV